jgi:hypothetical protein
MNLANYDISNRQILTFVRMTITFMFLLSGAARLMIFSICAAPHFILIFHNRHPGELLRSESAGRDLPAIRSLFY